MVKKERQKRDRIIPHMDYIITAGSQSREHREWVTNWL